MLNTVAKDLGEGILQATPLTNVLLLVFKDIPKSISDTILLKKLKQFFEEFNTINIEERRKMVKKLENEPKYNQRVGEHLIELLDRVESGYKPKMVAKIFKAYANVEIDLVMFHRLNRVTEDILSIYVKKIKDDFQDIEDIEDMNSIIQSENNEIAQYFSNIGLFTPTSGGAGAGGLIYVASGLLKKFIELKLYDVD